MLHQQVVAADLQNILQALSSSTQYCLEVCAVEEKLH